MKEALVQVVGEGVLQRIPGEQRPKAQQRLKRHHVVRFAPGRHELRVVGLARVVAHGDAGVVGQLPERVEQWITGRTHADLGGDRSGNHDDKARVVAQRPLELPHGVIRYAQRDVWGGENPFLIGESPVLLHPANEGVEGRRRGLPVGQQRLLHPDPEGGQHDAALHALFVHGRQPSVAVTVFGANRLQVAEQCVEVGASGIAAAEVLVERAGLADRVEGRIRDEPVYPAPDDQPRSAVQLGPLDGTLFVFALDVAGERVHRLVVVVVAVEEREPELGLHRRRVLSVAGPDPAEPGRIIEC
ncbi:hypothetical protein [Mycobacterium marinum]|uniref:hypothetical protein n=1 Tax=Mycobacterium marinum TaxID=1781 RepID=UPI0021C4A269|nr:hypothetical protein [Mycobacterium marinum]